jgi:hypothetical protein
LGFQDFQCFYHIIFLKKHPLETPVNVFCLPKAQEHLIEREFLKRDEKNRPAYVYLPYWLHASQVSRWRSTHWTQLREHLDSTVQRWQKEEQKHCGRSICKHVICPGENGLRICNYPKLSILISINLRSILHTISLAEMNRPRTTLASPSKQN